MALTLTGQRQRAKSLDGENRAKRDGTAGKGAVEEQSGCQLPADADACHSHDYRLLLEPEAVDAYVLRHARNRGFRGHGNLSLWIEPQRLELGMVQTDYVRKILLKY
ncbi:MAG: hypothetical protein QGF53_12375 [Alphaproteobacteria bacterium]|nr:hypothetical protein [Alphaproteobacteria bacterium]